MENANTEIDATHGLDASPSDATASATINEVETSSRALKGLAGRNLGQVQSLEVARPQSEMKAIQKTQRTKKPLKAAPEKPLTPKQLERKIKNEKDEFFRELKSTRRMVLKALRYPDSPTKLPPDANEKGVSVAEMTSALYQAPYQEHAQDVVQDAMDDLSEVQILERIGPSGLFSDYRYRLRVPVELVTEKQIFEFLENKEKQFADQFSEREGPFGDIGQYDDPYYDPLYRLIRLFLDILREPERQNYEFIAKLYQACEEPNAKELAEAAKGVAPTITGQKVS